MKKIYSIINGFSSKTLARDSFIVFLGSLGANIGSYVYHVIMGKLLGPAGYGELSSLLSIFYIFSVPLSLATTVLVKFISTMKAKNELGGAKTLFLKITKFSLIACLIGLPIIILISPIITNFLHINSMILFILVYIYFVLSLLTVIAISNLQGYQKFFYVSVFGAGSIFLKLLLSIPGVSFGVFGVLIATILSSLIIYLLYIWSLQFLFNVKAQPINITKKEALKFALPTLGIILGMTSLYSTDMILVKHYFLPYDAGLYAGLTMLGKIIFYASSAVSIVMFPVLSERTAKGEKGNKLVLVALGIVAIVSTSITILYTIIPKFIVTIVLNSSYNDASSLLGLFGLFLICYSIANMFATVFMALGKTIIWYLPILSALAQILGITLFHSSLKEVIWVNILTNSLLVIFLLRYYIKHIYEKI